MAASSVIALTCRAPFPNLFNWFPEPHQKFGITHLTGDIHQMRFFNSGWINGFFPPQHKSCSDSAARLASFAAARSLLPLAFCRSLSIHRLIFLSPIPFAALLSLAVSAKISESTWLTQAFSAFFYRRQNAVCSSDVACASSKR